MKPFLIVGGNWGKTPKESSIVTRLFNELHKLDSRTICFNGGSLDFIESFIIPTFGDGKKYNIIWMPNISNEHPQKYIDKISPYVISKNCYDKAYYHYDLMARILKTQAELLLRFDSDDNKIVISLLSRSGIYLCTSTGLVGDIAYNIYEYSKPLYFPVKRFKMPSAAGQFGAVRKHDRHSGVDLYCGEDTHVYAMEDGYVISAGIFTGEMVGSPWWNETHYVMVQGKHGVINYGEITPFTTVGQTIKKGDRVGAVKRVLKRDKGLPTSMLHIERYMYGATEPINSWELTESQPYNLLDITPLLRNCK